MNICLICSLPSCKAIFENSKQLVVHLKNHIREGFCVDCRVLGCGKTYKVLSSLTSHLSRQHKIVKISSAPKDTLSEVSARLDVDINADVEPECNNGLTNIPVSSLPKDDLLQKQTLF